MGELRTWSLGIYNVYSRQNPYLYYLDENPDKNEGTQKTVAVPGHSYGIVQFYV